jgi:hypothetical protein
MNRQKGELPVEQTHGQSVLSEEPLQIIQPDHDAVWPSSPSNNSCRSLPDIECPTTNAACPA